MASLVFHTKDSPGRSGVTVPDGTRMYGLSFRLDTDEELMIYCGIEGLNAFHGMLHEIETDELIESIQAYRPS